MIHADALPYLNGLRITDVATGHRLHLVPCCDEPDLTVDITPIVSHGDHVVELPEVPLCTDGVVDVASWLTAVLAGLIEPGEPAINICSAFNLRVVAADTDTVTVHIAGDRVAYGRTAAAFDATIRATREELHVSARWWQRRAAGHLTTPDAP